MGAPRRPGGDVPDHPAGLRVLAAWHRSVPAPPDEAFTRLAEAFAADPYTQVVACDHAARTLRVEGQGWYVGELAVEPAAPGGATSRATLRASSSAPASPRAWLRERFALRFARRQFRTAVRGIAAAQG